MLYRIFKMFPMEVRVLYYSFCNVNSPLYAARKFNSKVFTKSSQTRLSYTRVFPLRGFNVISSGAKVRFLKRSKISARKTFAGGAVG